MNSFICITVYLTYAFIYIVINYDSYSKCIFYYQLLTNNITKYDDDLKVIKNILFEIVLILYNFLSKIMHMYLCTSKYKRIIFKNRFLNLTLFFLNPESSENLIPGLHSSVIKLDKRWRNCVATLCYNLISMHFPMPCIVGDSP